MLDYDVLLSRWESKICQCIVLPSRMKSVLTGQHRRRQMERTVKYVAIIHSCSPGEKIYELGIVDSLGDGVFVTAEDLKIR
ncbi:hypothetical protein CEXT_263261 [Caerostris extrusa]|uniref:Uncharacterized protein n=1 Tax=Caerostris extrusa TaxID=172846 RepID=A0AAV4Y979_CAEEX|nr:hypothetical protein CEXT_263261 [Caerostris extrusa]